jgi:threonine/homoserine/homoserine lactone efflux protein
MNQLLVFVGVSLVVIVVPGPDTVLVLRNTLSGGRVAGLTSTLGIATGQVFWALMTSMGIAALVLASRPIFLTAKLAGAGYLIFLGVRGCFAVLRGRSGGPERATPVPRSAWRAYRQGVISDLGNPKIAAFFTRRLPQFVPNHAAAFAELLSFGVVFAALTAGWLAFYVIVAEVFRRVLSRTRVRQAIECVTGTVLIALGISVAADVSLG